MRDTKELLRETRDRIAPPPDVLGSLERRRYHREQVRRGSAVVVAIVIALVGLGGLFVVSRDAAKAPVVDPSPSDLGIFRQGGEFTVFTPRATGPGWDLAAQDPETGAVRTIVETDGDRRLRGACDAATLRELHQEGRVVGRRPLGCVRGHQRQPRRVGVRSLPSHGRDLGSRCIRYAPTADDALREPGVGIGRHGRGVVGLVPGGRCARLRAHRRRDRRAVRDRPLGWHAHIARDGQHGSLLHASLAWSPDGSRIAYVEGSSVYAVDVEGGDRSLLADSFEDIIDIAWSPDGTQILVHDQGRYRIQVMNADGSDLHVLVEGEDACCETAWSPNGDRIVVHALHRNRSRGQRRVV